MYRSWLPPRHQTFHLRKQPDRKVCFADVCEGRRYKNTHVRTCEEEGVGRAGEGADLCSSTLGAGQLGARCWLPIRQTLHHL